MSSPRRGRVARPSSPNSQPPRSNSLPNSRPAPPAPPLIGPTGSPTLDCIADAVNSTVAPFQNAPPPEQGAAGWVAQGLGGVLGVVGAPQQLIDNAFAGLTAPIAALFPSMPAITLLGMHVGMLHTHAHPPSLIPPAPPIPLPSIGMLVGAGAISVLGCGLPLARAGDIGISVTCGTFAPPFEVFTGSSNVFVGGARAARLLDITKHCDPTAMGPFGIAMAVAGVAAGVAGAVATGQAAQAAQAAADAAILALKLLAGKDPGIPPGVGALLGPPCPTVMIGGFPCPPIGDMAVGALMKGLKKLAQAAKKLRSSRRANGNCADGSHPIYLVTGENFDEFTDFVSEGLFCWRRHYTTARSACDGPLGFGFRHSYQRHLDVRLHRIVFIDWDGVELEFPACAPGENEVREHGYVLRRVTASHYELSLRGEPTLVFYGDRFTEVLPLSEVRAASGTLEFNYDERGWLASVHERDGNGRRARDFQFHHDAVGHIVAIDELGPQSVGRFACSYTSAGELHQVRDACNGLWTYSYDDAHRWTRQTDPRGYSYDFRYDEEGRCIWASGQDGLWRAEVEYHPDQGLTRYTEGEGAVFEYHYDQAGFITKIVAPDGGVRIRERSIDGRVLRDIDAGGRTLTFVYDHDGAELGRRDRFGYLHPPQCEGPRLADPFARRLPDTALSRLLAGVVEPSPETVLGVDERFLEFPTQIQPLAQSLFGLRDRGAGPVAGVPRSQHDALGRRLLEVDARERVRRWEYDASGNPVVHCDRDGRVYRQETTSWNLVGSRVDPLGNAMHYRYDSLEQITEIRDPLGNSTRYEYDACRRLTKIWRGDRLRDRYEYDRGHHLVAKYDGSGELLFRNAEFHANGFVARRELASGGEHRFAYDSFGRITEASTAEHEIRCAFDLEGVRRVDLCNGRGVERLRLHAGERTIVLGRFAWSLAKHGSRLRLTAPTGATITVEVRSDGMVVRDCGTGTVEWSQFDESGRLEARMAAGARSGSQTPWHLRCRYSKAGDLLALEDSLRGGKTFAIDAAHRLCAVEQAGTHRLDYSYDEGGNLIAKPGLSRLQIGTDNRAIASATEVFEYDPRGRCVSRRERGGVRTHYRYDSFDQLVAVDWDGRASGGWSASYDALGRRMTAGHAETRHQFYWDGDRLAAEVDSDGRLRIYLYAGWECWTPLAFVDYPSEDAAPQAGQLYHVFSDQLGAPLHIEDQDGRRVWSVTNPEAYGAVELSRDCSIEYSLRWPGHYFDAATGLFYNRYRYYDPRLGRYLSPDPIGYRGSPVNLYAYCHNPLIEVDMLGLTHPGKANDTDQRDTSGDHDGVESPPKQGGAVDAKAAKIVEQGQWVVWTQTSREDAANAILKNKVSNADYQRLNYDGVKVVFDLETKPLADGGMKIAGHYFPYGQNAGDPATVVIYVKNNANAEEIASTLSHEATHHVTHTTQPKLAGTHADEYNSFRREFEFKNGRSPNPKEQQEIMDMIQKTYPDLDPPPSSWSLY